jgi:hypothetical protein
MIVMANEETAMQTDHPNRQERLFMLRLWKEEVAVDQYEWRGRIYDVTTGKVRYFRNWSSLIPLILAMVRNTEQPQEQGNCELFTPPVKTGV